MQATMENPAKFQIRSCLPMLAIIYMDRLDIPVGLQNKHVIYYSVPSIRFVFQKDFDWVDKVDKNKVNLVQPFYGKHTQFRLLCNTPYVAQLVDQGVSARAASGQRSQIQGAEVQEKDSQSNEAEPNVEVVSASSAS